MRRDRKEYMRKYQREYAARKRKEFFDGKRCAKCGSTDNLELDHIDPKTKVSHNIWTWGEEKKLAELAKCQVLCHDCHLKKTIEQFSTPIVHGLLSSYHRRKCRCDACRAANAKSCAEWKKKTKYRTSDYGPMVK